MRTNTEPQQTTRWSSWFPGTFVKKAAAVVALTTITYALVKSFLGDDQPEESASHLDAGGLILSGDATTSLQASSSSLHDVLVSSIWGLGAYLLKSFSWGDQLPLKPNTVFSPQETLSSMFQVHTRTPIVPSNYYIFPAAVVPVGDELLFASISTTSSDTFVLTTPRELLTRRYDVTGNALSEDFVLSNTVSLLGSANAGQRQFATAVNADHSVLVWSTPVDPYQVETHINGIVYNTSGPVGSVFRISKLPPIDYKYAPIVVTLPNNQVATIWEAGATFDNMRLYVQITDLGGNRLFPTELRLGKLNVPQKKPVAVSLSSGFAAAWEAGAPTGTYVQRYNATAYPVGTEIYIPSASKPLIAPLSEDDELLVSYVDLVANTRYAVRYDAANSAVSNMTIPAASAIAPLKNKGFFTVSVDSTNPGFIYGQQHLTSGSEYQSALPFKISDSLHTLLAEPNAISIDGNSKVVVTWKEAVNPNGGYDVYGRIISSLGSASFINESPTLSHPAITINYNGTAIAVAPALLITDDGLELEQAIVSIDNAASVGDALSVGRADPLITSNFRENSGTLTLTGSAALSVWQAVLRSVLFSTTSDVKTARVITFLASDGNAFSNVLIRTVNMITVEGLPIPTESSSSRGITQNAILGIVGGAVGACGLSLILLILVSARCAKKDNRAAESRTNCCLFRRKAVGEGSGASQIELVGANDNAGSEETAASNPNADLNGVSNSTA